MPIELPRLMFGTHAEVTKRIRREAGRWARVYGKSGAFPKLDSEYSSVAAGTAVTMRAPSFGFGGGSDEWRLYGFDTLFHQVMRALEFDDDKDYANTGKALNQHLRTSGIASLALGRSFARWDRPTMATFAEHLAEHWDELDLDFRDSPFREDRAGYIRRTLGRWFELWLSRPAGDVRGDLILMAKAMREATKDEIETLLVAFVQSELARDSSLRCHPEINDLAWVRSQLRPYLSKPSIKAYVAGAYALPLDVTGAIIAKLWVKKRGGRSTKSVATAFVLIPPNLAPSDARAQLHRVLTTSKRLGGVRIEIVDGGRWLSTRFKALKGDPYETGQIANTLAGVMSRDFAQWAFSLQVEDSVGFELTLFHRGRCVDRFLASAAAERKITPIPTEIVLPLPSGITEDQIAAAFADHAVERDQEDRFDVPLNRRECTGDELKWRPVLLAGDAASLREAWSVNPVFAEDRFGAIAKLLAIADPAARL